MKVVSAAVIVQNGKIFIAQRPAGKSLAHCWEFPGGKREEGETLPQCLQREIMEELSAKISVGEEIMCSTFDYEFGTIELHAFWAKLNDGETLRPSEHENTAWAAPSELKNYTFAPADRPIIEFLQSAGLSKCA